MGAAKRFTQNPGRNAICYYRYSSDAQRDASIEQQQEEARKYAGDHGLRIIKEYADRAVSGTRDDRAQYNLMLSESGKLKPAYLILWKTDRLSRDRYDGAIAKKILRDNGVKIIYTAESMPDGDEATEILLESLYEGIAASFIESHRKNVQRGMDYNAERCLYNGIKLIGYHGETDRPYEIDPETAPIVTRIFNEYADGTPMQRIVASLNDQGIKTSTGGNFTINSLRRILTNRSYIGEYSWGKFTTPGGMPRIISDELFERVRLRLAANQHGGKGAKRKLDPEAPIADYWLSGHLFCGKCGESMQGISGTGKTNLIHFYYSCKGHRQHRCDARNKPKALVERIVLHALDEIVHDPVYRLAIADACYARYLRDVDDGGAMEDAIKAQLHDTETALANIMRAIEAGIFNATTGKRMEELEATRDRLEDALRLEQAKKRCQLTPHVILKYLDSLDGNLSDPQARDRLLDEYVSRVLVDDKKVTVVLRYTDEAKEMPIKETIKMLDRGASAMANLRAMAESEQATEVLISAGIIGGDEDPDFFG